MSLKYEPSSEPSLLKSEWMARFTVAFDHRGIERFEESAELSALRCVPLTAGRAQA